MGVSISSIYHQVFPPKPPLTGANLPNLVGKVFIITGATSGVGLELTKFLYAAGGTVFMLTRDETVTVEVIKELESQHLSSTGTLHHIHIDLADLSTVAPAVTAFSKSSSRLDVLFNNAGIASAPLSYKTSQGLEPHYGTNCAAPHLLTKLLMPILISTAKTAAPNSVRVIWTSSLLVDVMSPKGGVNIEQLRNPNKNRNEHYSASKACNWYLVSEWDRRVCRASGIISITQNPGNLATRTWRTTPKWSYWPFIPVLYKGIFGAYTNLWAAFDNTITISDGGRYVLPFGRWHLALRQDLILASRSKDEGGIGRASEVWNWCEETVLPYIPHEA